MSTDLVKTDPANPLALEVTASTPLEMGACQSLLVEWCGRKIEAVKAEAEELAAAFQQAVEKKWKSSTLKRHSELALKRVTFYEKIKAALQAGYCIVPNFPISLFAIRTDREKPAKCYSVDTYYNVSSVSTVARQEAKALPAGEGDYHAESAPLKAQFKGEEISKSGTTMQKYATWSEEWGEIEFPINMAKPQIMEATGTAMAQRIFDELGVLPDPRPKKDPMIIGRIIDPRSTTYNKRHVSFIIAWHLNVRDL